MNRESLCVITTLAQREGHHLDKDKDGAVGCDGHSYSCDFQVSPVLSRSSTWPLLVSVARGGEHPMPTHKEARDLNRPMPMKSDPGRDLAAHVGGASPVHDARIPCRTTR